MDSGRPFLLVWPEDKLGALDQHPFNECVKQNTFSPVTNIPGIHRRTLNTPNDTEIPPFTPLSATEDMSFPSLRQPEQDKPLPNAEQPIHHPELQPVPPEQPRAVAQRHAEIAVDVWAFVRTVFIAWLFAQGRDWTRTIWIYLVAITVFL